MSDGTNPHNNLSNWADELLEKITAAARDAVNEGDSGPPGPTSPDPGGPPASAVASQDQAIYEAIAEGLAHLRQPDLGAYGTDDVRNALNNVFPNKSGPPSAEWIAWLKERVGTLSSGLTNLHEDEHPAVSGGVLFRVYYGKLTGSLATRSFVLSPMGVEYTD